MSILHRHDETEALLKKENPYLKWSQKLFKWPYCSVIFLLTVLILAVTYTFYLYIDSEVGTKFNKCIKAINSPRHVMSLATTNADYINNCAPPVKCNSNSKYRSLNGSCNNLGTPTWGAAETPYIRMLNANYSDGISRFRLQTNGHALPSVRLLNIELFLGRDTYRVDENNALLLSFAQLLSHDVSGTTIDTPTNERGEPVDCCRDERVRKTYPQCEKSVENPPDDPVYSKHNISCMKILRYQTSRNYSCPLNPSTYIDTNSHYVDASEVYGSNDENALRLRAMKGGRLKFSASENGQMFCPFVTGPIPEIQAIDVHKDDVLFDTGDHDGNQNLGITAMHTLFLRFHNHVAFKLSLINPHWSDEILYQESRRIIVATKQRIVYEDLLPIIIGDDFQESYGLNKASIYDPNINPSMSLELSGAALRVLHTIIPVQFKLMDKDYKIEDSIIITDWLAKSNLLPLDNNFDKLLKGLLETPGRVPQPSYNFYISNYMFNYLNKPRYTGRDLLSGDIASSRDFGLQPYIRVRNLCGYSLATDFDDLVDIMHLKDVNKLKKLYHSVDDIDLMVGLLLEKLSDGAMVGPTAQCLIADGFYRLKAGDRFFYDTQRQPGSFTLDQLKMIKKITLGHVICSASNVDHVQKDIFKAIDHNLFPTAKLICDDGFLLDFKAWKEPTIRSDL